MNHHETENYDKLLEPEEHVQHLPDTSPLKIDLIDKIRETEAEKLSFEKAHEQLRVILDTLPVGIRIMSHDDWSLLYSNRACLELFGCSSFEEQVKGQNGFGFMPEYQPDGRKTAAVINEFAASGGSVLELQCLKLDGEPFICRSTSCIINYEGHTASLAAMEDVTAERKHQETLRNAVLREREANQFKSRFLATVSHEIRTPMNAILGMTELALRENDADLKNDYIMTIKQSGESLLSLISDILDFAKIEAGKMEVINAEYSTASLISDVVNIIRVRVIDSNLRFVVKADSKIPDALFGDKARIRQVMLNILGNAVKYTEKGYVSLGVYGDFENKETVNLIIEIKDSGIGIKNEDIGKLFKDFTQLDNENKQSNEGVGLGLAITHRIITEMRGSVSVESEYGKGSTFTIKIPQKYRSPKILAEVADPEKLSVLIYGVNEINADSVRFTMKNLGVDFTLAYSAAEITEKLENNKYDHMFITYSFYKTHESKLQETLKNTKITVVAELGESVCEKHLNVLSPPVYCTAVAAILNNEHKINGLYSLNTESTAGFYAPEARVLIVDDIHTNLRVAQGLLAPYNMDVGLCNSGKAALEALQNALRDNKPYDMVFMDHKMPGMDGIETTQYIRELADTDNYYAAVPVIALTANVVSGMKEMFLNCGFNDFLPKPINTVKLNYILEKWIPKEKQENNSGYNRIISNAQQSLRDI